MNTSKSRQSHAPCENYQHSFQPRWIDYKWRYNIYDNNAPDWIQKMFPKCNLHSEGLKIHEDVALSPPEIHERHNGDPFHRGSAVLLETPIQAPSIWWDNHVEAAAVYP